MVAGLVIKLALVLNLATVVGAPMPAVVGQASAQATPRDATSRAQARLRASQTSLDREQARVRKLAHAHAAQLKAIDELKTKRASWNRDRKIRAAKADALATSQKLARSERELARLRVLVRNHRNALIAAVDAELKTSLTPQRQVELVALRSQLEGQQPHKRAARKIVLPDEAVDELADPEELEEQAALLAQVEKQLEREQTVLAGREKRYQRMAKLRDARRRADEFESFDGDGTPRRQTPRGERDPAAGSGGRGASAEADQQSESPDEAGGGGDDSGAPPTDPQPGTDDGGSFADSSVVLADVVDAGTADALRRADRSTDPRTKANAAKRAREQVESRLTKLRQLRKKLQQRARGLRGN